MLESLATTILNRYLGEFVENVGQESLNIQMWHGQVDVKGLCLKAGALDRFDLPLEVALGHIEHLEMRIPWNSLKSSPVVITITGLYAVLKPRSETEYNEEADDERKQTLKIKRLEDFEKLKTYHNTPNQQSTDSKMDGFTASLLSTVLNNIQVIIKDVHFRYEDSSSMPGQTVCGGVTVDRFEAQSTDMNWNEKFSQISAPVNYKLIDLKNIAYYVNPDGNKVCTPECRPDDFYERMLRMIGKANSKGDSTLTDDLQYIIKPITCQAKVKVNRTRPLDTKIPKLAVSIAMPTLPLTLRENQYESATNVAEAFSRSHRGKRYRKYRPSGSMTASEKWKFALRSVRHDISERNRRYTWTYFEARRLAKIEYLSAYIVKETQTPVPALVTETLRRLERQLCFEDIRYFRCLGSVQVHKNKSLRDAMAKKNTMEKNNAVPKPQTGFWSYFSGKSEPVDEATEPIAKLHIKEEDKLEVTAAQKEELFEIIGFVGEEAESSTSVLPVDYVSSTLSFTLDTGSFVLIATDQFEERPIAELMWDELSANLIHRSGSDSTVTKFSLGGVYINDLLSANTKFKAVIAPMDFTTHPHRDSNRGKGLASLLDNKQPTAPRPHQFSSSTRKVDADPLFSLTVELNPLDKKADKRIIVKSHALVIVYNQVFINNIVDFFTIPDELQVAHMFAAVAQQQISAQSAMWLALHGREVYDIDIKVDAPNILFPQRLDDGDSSLAILDMGHLHVVSRTSERKVQTEDTVELEGPVFVTPPESVGDFSTLTYDMNVDGNVQVPGPNSRVENSLSNVGELLYDRYTLSLTNAQVLVCQVKSDWRQVLKRTESTGERNIVDKFNMSLTIANLITKLNDYADVKVSAQLPSISMHVTDAKALHLVHAFKGALKAATSNRAPPGASTVMASNNVVDENVNEDMILAELMSTAKPETTPEAVNARLMKVLMDAKFEIGEISLTVGRENDIGKEYEKAPLVCVSVRGCKLSVVKRTFDTNVVFHVRSIDVPDKRGRGGEAFTSLISSQASELAVTEEDEKQSMNVRSAGSAQQLISVSARMTSSSSPELHTKCNGFEIILKAVLDTCCVNIIPECILEIREFLMSLPMFDDTLSERVSDKDHSDAGQKGIVNPTLVRTLSTTPRTPKVKKTKATLEVRQLDIALVQAKRGFLGIGVRDVVLIATMVPEVKQIEGSIRSICVNDLTGDAGPYGKLLLTKGSEVLSFGLVKRTDAKSGNEEMGVRMTAGQLQLLYSERFYQYLNRYLEHFTYARHAYEATLTAATEAAASIAESVNSVVVDVVVTAPIIVVPMTLTTQEVIVANLGVLTVTNISKPSVYDNSYSREGADVYTIGLQDMCLFTSTISQLSDTEDDLSMHPDLKTGRMSEMSNDCIVSNTSFDLIISKLTAAQETTMSFTDAPIDISGHLIGLDIVLCQATYQQIIGTLSGNLLYKREMDTSSFNLCFDLDVPSPPVVRGTAPLILDTVGPNVQHSSSNVADNLHQSKVKVTFSIPRVRLILRSEMAIDRADQLNTSNCSQQPTHANRIAAISHDRTHMAVQDLAILTLNDFTLGVISREKDVNIDITLGGLSINDLLRRNGQSSQDRIVVTDQPDLSDFGVNIPTDTESDGGNGSINDREAQDALVSIKVVMAEKDSPLWSGMDGNNRTVDVDFNNLGVILNLQTTVLLIDFFVGDSQLDNVDRNSSTSHSFSTSTTLPSDSPLLTPSINKSNTSRDTSTTEVTPNVDVAGNNAELWTINVKALVLTLNTTDNALCRLDIGGGQLQIRIGGVFEGGLQVEGKLGPGLLRDLTERGSVYSNVFRTVGKDILQLRYTKLGTESPPAIQLQDHHHRAKAGDSVLWVRLGSLQLLYTMRFFNLLADWLLNFQYLQGLVSFMRTGEEQMMNAKFYYDIAAPSPAIVVPVKSDSNMAFVAYPGNITLANSYEEVQVNSGNEILTAATVDSIEVELQAMELLSSAVVPSKSKESPTHSLTSTSTHSEIITSYGHHLVHTHSIMRQATLKLKVQRRLAPQDTQEALATPRYRIEGMVANVGMHLTDLQQSMFFELLTGNLSETTDTNTANDTSESSPDEISVKSPDGEFGSEVVLDFSLRFQNVTLRVYERTIGNMQGDQVPFSAEATPLMDFIMDNSMVNQRNLLDGHTRTEFTCKRFTVVDLRAAARGSKHVNVLTQNTSLEFEQSTDRTTEKEENSDDFLDFVMANSPSGNTTTKILLRHTRLLMIPDFFMEAWSFIAAPLDITPLHYVDFTNTESINKINLNVKNVNADTKLEGDDSDAKINLIKPEKLERSLKLTMHLMRPEAVFLYDFGSVHSSAVVVQGSFLFILQASSDGDIEWRGDLSNFSSYSYWLSKDDTRVTLLYPSKFQLEYTDKVDKMDGTKRIRDLICQAGRITLRLSMVELDLLRHLYNTYSSLLQPESEQDDDEISRAELMRVEENEREKKKLLASLSDMGYDEEWCQSALTVNNDNVENAADWLITNYSPKKKPPSIYSVQNLQTVKQIGLVPAKSPSPETSSLNVAKRLSLSNPPNVVNSLATPGNVVREQLTLDGEVYIQFYRTIGNVVQPLAELVSKPLMVDVRNWSSDNASLVINSRFSYDFFNTNLSSWESFLEPHGIRVEYYNKREKGRFLSIEPSEKLEVNISQPLFACMQTMIEGVSEKDPSYWKEAQDRVDYKPHMIRNLTGLPVTMYSSGDPTTLISVDSGQEVAFGDGVKDWTDDLGNGSQNEQRQKMQAALKRMNVTLQIEGHTKLQPIELVRMGRACYAMLEDTSTGAGRGGSRRARTTYVIVDVYVENNRRVVEVRSTVQIVNHMSRPLNIRSLTENTYSDYIIQAGKTFSIPVDMASANFKVRLLANKDTSVTDDTANVTKSVDQETGFCPSIVQWSRFVSKKKGHHKGTFASPLVCPHDPGAGDDHTLTHVMMHVTYEQSVLNTSYPLHCFSFWAPLRVQNLLPVDIMVFVKGPHGYLPYHVSPGGVVECHTIDTAQEAVIRVAIDKYEMSDDIIVASQKSVLANRTCLTPTHRADSALNIFIENKSMIEYGARLISLWASFWIVNMTGLQLLCKSIPSQGSRETLLPVTSPGHVQMHSLEMSKYPAADEIAIRTLETGWSNAMRLDPTGSSSVVTLTVGEQKMLRSNIQKQYEIGVKVKHCSGVYHRTRLIQLIPNILFLNVYGFPLEYVQDNVNTPAVTISSMQSTPFHWPVNSELQHLRIRAKGVIQGSSDVWGWSEPFSLNPSKLTHFTVKLRGNRNKQLVGYIPVSVTWVKAGHVVIFGRTYGKTDTSYIIRNNTALPLQYWQEGVGKEILDPKSEIAYGFDRLLTPQFLNVQVQGDDLTARAYELDNLQNKFAKVEYLRVFHIVANNDMVLEVCQTRDGQATIRLWPKREESTAEYKFQLWSIQPNGALVNPTTGLLAQVYGDGLISGARLYMNQPKKRASEQWQILPMISSVMSARQSDLVWEVDNLKVGSFLKLANRSQSPLQHFRPEYISQGTGILVPRLEVDGPIRILKFSDGHQAPRREHRISLRSRKSVRSDHLQSMSDIARANLGESVIPRSVSMASNFKGSGENDTSAREMGNDDVEVSDALLFEANLSIKGTVGMGISIIDHRPMELAYISVSGLQVQYVQTEQRTAIKVVIDHLQMDDQTFAESRRLFPSPNRVVFAPLDERQFMVPDMDVVAFTSACTTAQQYPTNKGLRSDSLVRRGKSSDERRNDMLQPFVHVVISQSNDSTDTVKIFHVAHALVQSFQLRMTDEFLYRMLDMFLTRKDEDKNTGIEASSLDNVVDVVEEQFSRTGNRIFYLQSLQLTSLDFFLSLIPSMDLPEDVQASAEHWRLPIVTLHNVRLSTDPFSMKHSFINAYDFNKTTHHFYKDQLMNQWYKVVTQGISAVSNAVGHSIASFALDADFERERMKRKEDQASSSPTGVVRSGLSGMTLGVLGGLSGILTQPVKGAKDDGASGLLRGLGKGVVGAFAKPTSGVVDFGLETMSALRESTRGPRCSAQVQRFQRHIPFDRIVVPYHEDSAMGQRLLLCLQASSPDGNTSDCLENYFAHTWLSSSIVLMVSTLRIMELEIHRAEEDSDNLSIRIRMSAGVEGIFHTDITDKNGKPTLSLRVNPENFQRNTTLAQSLQAKRQQRNTEEGIVQFDCVIPSRSIALQMKDNILAVLTLYQRQLEVLRFSL
eukprot:CFRG5907T1